MYKPYYSYTSRYSPVPYRKIWVDRYDSLEIECPIDRVAEVIDLCYDTLNNWPVETFDFLELPIGCEGELSFSDWGTARGIHEGSTQEDCLKLMERTKEDVVKTFGKWID